MIMSSNPRGSSADTRHPFRHFTRESLARIQANIMKKNKFGKKGDGECEEDEDKETKLPNPDMEDGMPLPIRLSLAFGLEFAHTPLEEIDNSLKNLPTFVVITSDQTISRFSATDSVLLLGPFNPIRLVAIAILTHRLSLIFMITTVILNCWMMTGLPSIIAESAEIFFVVVYTAEACVKIMARGFILEKYTYLRDNWNWLDFLILLEAYVTMCLGMSDVIPVRAFRALRAFKIVSILPGLKMIAEAIIESSKKLGGVIMLTVLSLTVFALAGMQLYMGALTQKCIKDLARDPAWNSSEYAAQLVIHNSDSTNWEWDKHLGEYSICSNSSGAGCPPNFTCKAGWGKSPDADLMSFDSFGPALLSVCRIFFIQDVWDRLYQQVIRASGPWNILFFFLVIFIGSLHCVNLVIAVLLSSYDELMVKAEEKELACENERKIIQDEEMARERVSLDVAAGGYSEIFVPNSPEEFSGDCAGWEDWNEASGRENTEINLRLTPEPLILNAILSNSSDSIVSIDGMGMHMGSAVLDIASFSYKNGSFAEFPADKGAIEALVPLKGTGIERKAAGTGDQDSDDAGENRELQRKRKVTKWFKTFCDWNWGPPWETFQKRICFILIDPFAVLLTTVTVVVNTLFLAIEHHGMENNPILMNTLLIGNGVFTGIYTAEAVMKLIVLSPKFYFQERRNIFDFIIVLLSHLELLLGDQNPPGTSALRILRLLRLFKLAEIWPTLRTFLSILRKVVAALLNSFLVVIVLIFCFSVIGMNLFSQDYYGNARQFKHQEMPRMNFTDFWHSFMLVFRLFCGQWVESFLECILVSGWICIPYFTAVVVVGYLIVLKLFLTLLLSSFTPSNLSYRKSNCVTTRKLNTAFGRISNFGRRAGGFVGKLVTLFNKKPYDSKNFENTTAQPNSEESIRVQIRKQNKFEDYEIDSHEKEEAAAQAISDESIWIHMREPNDFDDNEMDSQDEESTRQAISEESIGIQRRQGNDIDIDEIDSWEKEDTAQAIREESFGIQMQEENDLDNNGTDSQQEEEEELVYNQKFEEEVEDYPEDCCPTKFYKWGPKRVRCETPWVRRWALLRQQAFRLIQHKYFARILFLVILLSSVLLTLEDAHLENWPKLNNLLYYAELAFTAIFVLEMFIKWFGLGFKAYFTSPWHRLDFVVAMISLVNSLATLLGPYGIAVFETIKMLRALRSLRIIHQIRGLKVLVTGLVHAIPRIANILLICLFFWLVFAIMGVQLFSGKFYKCVDPNDVYNVIDYRLVSNKLSCMTANLTWINSAINFDHLGMAYMSLFQIATFRGWMGIMKDTTDARGVDLQPSREYNFAVYAYFVSFITIGSFFILNIFTGAITHCVGESKQRLGSSLEMFMTCKQKWRPQAFVFKIVRHKRFEILGLLFIGLNMLVMSLEKYQPTQGFRDAQHWSNISFMVIFILESVFKIFALQCGYFLVPWNVYDFGVAIISILYVHFPGLAETYFVSPNLLRLVRVAIVGRVLRLIKGPTGIRALFLTLELSIPGLLNICLFLVLIMFIYAIFGMSLFMNIELRSGLDVVFNFRTFGQSMILLFQLSTTAGWDRVLDGLTSQDEKCIETESEHWRARKCLNPAIGITYIASYLIISFFIGIQMCLAVVMESYSSVIEDMQTGLVDDDYKMFYEKFAEFDPEGTRYIPYDQLSDFLDALELPLRIRKPNKFKIVTMVIDICGDDMVFSTDLLMALTKEVISQRGCDYQEMKDLVCPGYTGRVVSSTLWKQRENYCARLIQSAWRRHRNRNMELHINLHEQKSILMLT